jgi:peptide methionine sulfoxide reductase msrA/msrB
MIKLKVILINSLTVMSLLSSCTSSAKNGEIGNSLKVTAAVVADVINADVDTLWTKKIEKSDSDWKNVMTDNQFHIMREKGTERPFTHAYNKNKKKGVFVCSACENPLFASDTKFNSGTGWPSFFDPYFKRSINVGADDSHGMSRDEVVCGRCDGHLGHVFNDGPEPTGLRYCINGESLSFVSNTEPAVAVFAQGCFWCVEEVFEAVKGVGEVVSGYSGGSVTNPTYRSVGSGSTNHAEAVSVTYDPAVISYDELLKVYFNSGDITQVNGQGNDIGKQYRSIVFYNTEEERVQTENYIKSLEASGLYTKGIAVEVLPLEKFYVGEEYHQDYVKLHPNEGYVKGVSIPRYEKAIKKFPELLK